MSAIYEGLELPGYDRAEPAFRAYLSSISGYEKNRFELTREAIDKVNLYWEFAFDEWGYERLSQTPTPQ